MDNNDTFTPYAVIPKQGGLAYSDYPNPYGVRAYQNKKGGYSGEMIPKSIGYLGPQQGQGKMAGQVMTEFSLEDDKGSYPSLVPTLTQQELQSVLSGVITPEIDQKAKAFRDSRISQGLDPFLNTFNP
jgi:hypothetical protein